ncbi:hypothetical protein ADL26_04570 [Thermoactinomyces vulgaris]|nr:hypothetical protein ADL26_04570 [Thermoactinomyces vulgaris]
MKKAVLFWSVGICAVGLLLWWGNEALRPSKRGITIMAEPIVAQTLKQMTQDAALIVVAVHQGEVERPSTGSSMETKVFSFAVRDTLKGDAPDNIHVRVPYRHVETLSVDGEKVEVALKRPKYIAPKTGESMVLFLSQRDADGTYLPAFQPFLIARDGRGAAKLMIGRNNQSTVELSDGTRVTLKEEVQIKDEITGRSFAEVVEEIEQMTKKQPGS